MVATQDLNVQGLSSPCRVVCWAPGIASATLALHDGEPCGDAALWLPATAPAEPAAQFVQAAQAAGLLVIADGLGHGPQAAAAAEAVLQLLQQAPDAGTAPLATLMQRLDQALLRLRGAAVGLLRVQGRGLTHLGVGNTRAMRLRDGQLARLPSHNGIVGGGLPERLLPGELDLQPGDWLLLFTDGLDEHLRLPVLLPEWAREPPLLCRYLLLQHRLGRDDCGVLVMHVPEA